MKPTWFEKLTGFPERSPGQVRTELSVEGQTIISRVNGRRMQAGQLKTPRLSELRERVAAEGTGEGSISVSEIVADAQALHADPAAEGALFQVASQFNLLEMLSPSATPEDGVGIYAYDPTQGPACAIAAGAGTIFRNYFVNVDGRTGQTAKRQIDCLRSMASILGNRRAALWSMKNGYALASESGLYQVAETLASLDKEERDYVRGSLMIGLQLNTEVTLDNCGHLVTQAYCSALPVAYSVHPAELWEPFARIVLEATYEATLAAAVLNCARTGNNCVNLTLVGGGAFGNEEEWIVAAVNRALDLYESYSLDVRIVSYGAPNPRLRELV